MAKVFYSRKTISNNPAMATPRAIIEARILNFWVTADAERYYPVSYWKMDKYFKDYNKVAIYINSDDKDEMEIEVRPFISANIKEYESDNVHGYFFVIFEEYYKAMFTEDNKIKAVCMVRIGKTEDDEITIFLNKSLPIDLNNGAAGPDGAGGGADIPVT